MANYIADNSSDCRTSNKSKSRSESCVSTTNPIWKNELIDVDFYEVSGSNFGKKPYCLDELLHNPDSVQFHGTPKKRLSNWLIKYIGAKDILCQYNQIPAFKSTKFPRIYPFLIRLDTSKADICIEFGANSPKYPGLIIEVVYKDNFKDTVANCVILMIDQFRYLRLFFEMPCICGYVFPNNSAKCVVKIVIEWKKLQFTVTFERLERDDVLNDVKEVFNAQCFEKNLKPVADQDLYFMKLSNGDLEEIKHDFNIQDDLEQVPSSDSIIMRDKNFYYKIIPIDKRQKTLSNMLNILYLTNHYKPNINMDNYVFPINFLNFPNYSANIFKFQKQAFAPLSKTEAKDCLVDLVDQIIPVLSNFHQNFNHAHNDVRLPNICFDENGTVRLIDFDFADKSWTIAKYSDEYPFLLNPPPDQLQDPKWTHADLDFKQLGLMIFCVLLPTFSQTKVEEKDVLNKMNDIDAVHRDFLNDMIFRCDHSKLQTWKKNNDNSNFSSIKSVLAERNASIITE